MAGAGAEPWAAGGGLADNSNGGISCAHPAASLCFAEASLPELYARSEANRNPQSGLDGLGAHRCKLGGIALRLNR